MKFQVNRITYMNQSLKTNFFEVMLKINFNIFSYNKNPIKNIV